MARRDDILFLQVGDLVECTVDGLSFLKKDHCYVVTKMDGVMFRLAGVDRDWWFPNPRQFQFFDELYKD